MNNPDQSRCPIFGDELFKEGSSLLEGIERKVKVFDKGDVIARQGDTCKGLYLLTKGTVKTEMVNENGGLISIEKINAVRPLAPAFIFAKVNIFPVDVIAMEKSEVLFIAKEDILKLFQRDTSFMERYIQYNSNKAQFLSDKLQMLTIKTIRGKLAHYILEIYFYHQQPSQKTKIITLDKNQTELAKYFGVTRPSLARILREMEREGLIQADKKKITLLDLNGLKEARG
ncbi:MAG: Crp/Fnr family transcriptional regulator [Rikenellaceae bacterium]